MSRPVQPRTCRVFLSKSPCIESVCHQEVKARVLRSTTRDCDIRYKYSALKLDYLSSTTINKSIARGDIRRRARDFPAHKRVQTLDEQKFNNIIDMSFWAAHAVVPVDDVTSHRMGLVAVTATSPTSQLKAMLRLGPRSGGRPTGEVLRSGK